MTVILIIYFLVSNFKIANLLAGWLSALELIKVKPFNCEGCLTFWLSFALGLAMSVGAGVYGWVTIKECVLYSGLALLAGLAGYVYVEFFKYDVYE